MDQQAWTSSDEQLSIGPIHTLYSDGKTSTYLATKHIASAGVKKTDNPMLFFGGFTVSLVGLVLFSFGLPALIVSAVVGLGVLLFLSSLFVRKTRFVIATSGSESLEIPLGKFTKEDAEQAMEVIQQMKEQETQPGQAVVVDGSQQVEGAGKRSFKALTPKK